MLNCKHCKQFLTFLQLAKYETRYGRVMIIIVGQMVTFAKFSGLGLFVTIEIIHREVRHSSLQNSFHGIRALDKREYLIIIVLISHRNHMM